MRNRWFHKPLLHIGESGIEKKAGWLELFYDLIFVAAFIQLGNSLSSDISVQSVLAFMGLFATLWVNWLGFTFYINRFTVDDFLHRSIVLLQMFAVGCMAMTAPGVIKGEAFYFTIAYVIAQSLISVLYFRTYIQELGSKIYSVYWGGVFAFSAVLWIISLFVPSPYQYILMGTGVLAVLLSPLSSQSREISELYPLDWEHLIERFALLTIIVLGESFVKVVTSFANQSIEIWLLGQAILILLITACVWWIYFDDVAESKIRKKRFDPFIWLYAHLFLQIGITALGVALKKAVFFNLSEPGIQKYAWLLTGTLAMTLISAGIIDSVTERKQSELTNRTRVNIRIFSGIVILILGGVSSSISAGLLILLITTICVAQIFIDMAIAPFEDSDIELQHQLADQKKNKENVDLNQTKVSPRVMVGNAIRKGTPSELRKDLYFFLMDGSWKKVFGSMIFSYLIVNILFALLYLLKPGSISNANPHSFMDAFFFSVQTMSTIGYGGMTPETIYGNILVTIEAAVGILGVAFITGLMFAKASRATTSVLFSKNCIITEMDGKSTLAFRAGNARGNDIVDASLSFSVLLETVTKEGQGIRRVTELKCVRNKTPFFSLSWLVMHTIDESSPLYGIDWSNPESVLVFTVLIIGHDGTYGQTVYARHVWNPDDIKLNHQFVDVLETLPDGRLRIHYDLFHDTYPV